MNQLIINLVIYALILCVITQSILLIYPRLFLKDYPDTIQKLVPPLSKKEQVYSLLAGLIFLSIFIGYPLQYVVNHSIGLTFFTAFCVNMLFFITFNIIDLLVLDYFIFVRWTPDFLVLKGTSGHKDYKCMHTHLQGFLKGIVLSSIISCVNAGIALLV